MGGAFTCRPCESCGTHNRIRRHQESIHGGGRGWACRTDAARADRTDAAADAAALAADAAVSAADGSDHSAANGSDDPAAVAAHAVADAGVAADAFDGYEQLAAAAVATAVRGARICI